RDLHSFPTRRSSDLNSPDIISRGFVYMREKADLINKTRDGVKKTFAKHATTKVPDDWSNIKGKIRDNVSEFLFRETERRPLVLPDRKSTRLNSSHVK